MHSHLPIWKKTFEFFKRLGGNSETVTFGTIAKLCGKESETAQAWARPTESDEFPTGTGKRNPSDMQLRLLGLAYEDNPGFAREWAEMFPAYVDYLDAVRGRSEATKGNLCEVFAVAVKEQTDIVLAYMNDGEDTQKIWSEAMQARTALNQLIACLAEQMKSETESLSKKAVN